MGWRGGWGCCILQRIRTISCECRRSRVRLLCLVIAVLASTHPHGAHVDPRRLLAPVCALGRPGAVPRSDRAWERTRSINAQINFALSESGERGGARASARELVVGRSGSVDSKLSRASQGKILSALLVHWQLLHRPGLAFFGRTAGRYLCSLMKSIALAWSRPVPIACPSHPR